MRLRRQVASLERVLVCARQHVAIHCLAHTVRDQMTRIKLGTLAERWRR